MLNQLNNELNKKANPEKAKILQRFFKTQKGQYGEGDIFLGLTVPEERKIAKEFIQLTIKEIKTLLNSNIHEKRSIAILILIEQYKKSSPHEKEIIFDFYIENSKQINNWDLVDLSAPNIVGDFLLEKPKDILYELAKSDNLWQKRISIISTYTFIKNNQFEDTLRIAEILLNDKHDLIHKAVGWMLRELGKRNQELEEFFLQKYYKQMPRIMLRYAIEKFKEDKRQDYLKARI